MRSRGKRGMITAAAVAAVTVATTGGRMTRNTLLWENLLLSP